MLRYLTLFPCLLLLSGISNAGQVSGTANVELDDTNIEITYDSGNGGNKHPIPVREHQVQPVSRLDRCRQRVNAASGIMIVSPGSSPLPENAGSYAEMFRPAPA